MADPIFLDIEFEGITNSSAEDLVVALGDSGLYEHITGTQFNFVGVVNPRTNASLDHVVDTLTSIVHEYNGGLYAEVKQVEESAIEHLL